MQNEDQITLLTGNNETFHISKKVIVQHSQTIKEMLLDTDDLLIPVPNITGALMPKIIEWCEYQYDASEQNVSKEDIEEWNKEYVSVDKEELYRLIIGADFLGIQSLIDITGQTIADMITGKTPDEIRTHFNIVNDLTPDEEHEIRQRNTWKEE